MCTQNNTHHAYWKNPVILFHLCRVGCLAAADQLAVVLRPAGSVLQSKPQRRGKARFKVLKQELWRKQFFFFFLRPCSCSAFVFLFIDAQYRLCCLSDPKLMRGVLPCKQPPPSFFLKITMQERPFDSCNLTKKEALWILHEYIIYLLLVYLD